MAKVATVFSFLLLAMVTSTAHAQKSNVMDSVFAVLVEWPNPNATGNPLGNVTLPCYRDMQSWLVDLSPPVSQKYAREMYESSASFRTDYDLTYNTKDPGNFWMCRQVTPQKSGHRFGGRYCGTATVVDQFQNQLYMGTCFPDSCKESDVNIFVLEGFRHGTASPYYSTESTCAGSHALRGSDKAAIVICSILLLLLLLGTALDICRSWTSTNAGWDKADGESQNEVEHLNPTESEDESLILNTSASNPRGVANVATVITRSLLAFSVLDTGRKILSTKAGRGSIPCLNGIRVLSMFWIVLLHTYLFVGASSSYSGNYRYVTDVVYQRWTATVLWQGSLGVEAFLVLSGLLVSYLTLKQFDKCGGPRKHDWLLFYFHRYWRLTPVYAFCLMMYTTLTLHMGNGVWWYNWHGAQEICQQRWWANMLYIHNLYPFPGDVSQCMGWSWYLSVDMQLYVVSPIFIIAFYKSWKAGFGLSIGTILCSFAVSAYLATVQGMPVGVDTKVYGSPKYEPGDWLYGKPYYRIPQYLVGVSLGYVLYRLKGNQVRINKILNLCIWCCVAAVALAVVYGVYPTAKGDRLPQYAAVIYTVFHRFAFSLSVGWVIFACCTGNGGPVNTLLSWSFWQPLARMTYSTYLVHLGVIFLYSFGFEWMWYYSDFHFGVEFTGILVISYAVAFATAMAVEFPMIGLERVNIRRKSKDS